MDIDPRYVGDEEPEYGSSGRVACCITADVRIVYSRAESIWREMSRIESSSSE